MKNILANLTLQPNTLHHVTGLGEFSNESQEAFRVKVYRIPYKKPRIKMAKEVKTNPYGEYIEHEPSN